MTLLSKKNISKFAFAAALTTMPFLAAQADTPWTPQQWANQSQKYAIVQCLNNQGEYSDWWVRKWTVDVAPSDVKIFIGLPKNIVMQLDFQNPNGSAAKLVDWADHSRWGGHFRDPRQNDAAAAECCDGSQDKPALA